VAQLASGATAVLAGLVTVTAATGPQKAASVETLQAIGGLPAHLVGRLEEPVGFAQARSGEYVVLDRRAHTVYAIDARKTALRKVLQVGFEKGHLLQPAVLALSADDIFAVADAPAGYERIQFFSLTGSHLGGFHLYTRIAPRLLIGPLILNGVGSMAFTGKTLLLNRPETGALFSELDIDGNVLRHIGTLRSTGHEADRDVHLAQNIGLPLVDPAGGFYFVFQTGRPLFRKYDGDGALVFERHIEGTDLDDSIRELPTTWPRREIDGGRYPIVPPLVRTAAVDPTGHLWVSLMAPVTYVYDPRGEKVRTVQFRAAGMLSPASLFFLADGRLLVTPGCLEFNWRAGELENW